MPILFTANPTGALIKCGPLDGTGLTLAVMAAPCGLRPKPARIPKDTARLLELLLTGPRRATDTDRWRYDRLRESQLAELSDGIWSITPKGREWLKRPPPPSPLARTRAQVGGGR